MEKNILNVELLEKAEAPSSIDLMSPIGLAIAVGIIALT